MDLQVSGLASPPTRQRCAGPAWVVPPSPGSRLPHLPRGTPWMNPTYSCNSAARFPVMPFTRTLPIGECATCLSESARRRHAVYLLMPSTS